MIEPQNTMVPVAESRPVDAPPDEGEGFGAMLAQSLGLAPPVNPDAIQQINTNPQPMGRGRHGQAGQQAAGEQPHPQAMEGSAAASLPIGATPPLAPGAIAARGDDAEQLPANQVEPHLAPSRGVGSQRFMRTDRGVAPLPSLPTPPSTEPLPHVVRPIETIWKPQLTAEPVATAAPLQPTDEHAPSDQLRSPTPAAAPGIAPPDPTGLPVAEQTPVAEAVAPARTVEPTVAKPVQVDVVRGRTIPAPPVLDSSTATDETTNSAPRSGNSGPVVPPAAATPQRVELAPERPVRLELIPAPKVSRRSEAVAESAIAPASAPVSTDGDSGLGTMQAVGSSPAAANSPTSAGLQPAASALAERVMQAIDLQQTQPPPRSMTVDIPELEGLRLIVSVRSAGNVTVTPAGSTPNSDVFAPFATDLSRVLAERGFVMNGDSRRQGHNPYGQDEAPPAPQRNAGFRRRGPVDNDLRI